MKKVIGWALIVFCSFMLLIFSIAILTFFFDDTENTANSNTEKITTIMGFAIFIIVSFLGLRYGLKQIKKEKVIVTVEYNEVLDISVKGKIEFKAYRDLMFGLTLINKIYIYLFVIMPFSLIPLLSADAEEQSTYYLNLFFVLFILLIPVIIYFQIKKLYNTNSIFKEALTYHLTNASIQIVGDTVNSTQQWSHFIKIKETKNFFLFYHGAQVATLLEKKMFSEQELNEFKRFMKSLAIQQA